MRVARHLAVCGLAASLACTDGPQGPPSVTIDDKLRLRFLLQPLGDVPQPPGDAGTADRIELGRLLFFDPVLSGEKDVACGTCHHPAFAFADGRELGAGASGTGLGPARLVSSSTLTGTAIGLEGRNSPTVLNAAFNADENGRPSHLGLQFWDGRAAGLEVLARGPLTSRTEMAGDAYSAEVARDSVVARLRVIGEYIERFREAFPAEAALASGAEVITMDTYGRAVAAYERELVTRNSAFDRYARGDDEALTKRQKLGLELFFTKARCAQCHSGPMFSDFGFRVIGVPQSGPGGTVITGDDVGREEHTKSATDRYAFRTPTLRNVGLTAPYMHDGVFATLEDVVRFYDRGALPRHVEIAADALDPLLRTPLGLSDGEVAAIVDFLEALTDPGSDLDPGLVAVPDRVPSGLAPVFGVRAP